MTTSPLTMQAGEEMDRAVAEKVMGWILYGDRFGWGTWTLPQGDIIKTQSLKKMAGPDWSPSKSIVAAWEVIEKMGLLGWTTDVQWKGDARDYARTAEVSMSTWESTYRSAHAASDTAPLAICRAALAALLSLGRGEGWGVNCDRAPQCQSPASTRVEYGTDLGIASRGGPLIVHVCDQHRRELWAACASAVNAGTMHWVNLPVPPPPAPAAPTPGQPREHRP